MAKHEYGELVGCSEAIKSVQYLIHQVAKKNATAMIIGESGTGKELVARLIHQASERATRPFIALNCAAIPLELLESELFGHEKGAFTGAVAMRQGRFELAAGGTLFLDEIGDMPISMQAKLLRVLQEHTFERVGGNKPIKTDVRIITATHKNLEACLIDGSFREDLYYRLNVFPIEIPPLRNRPEDIRLLINHFIEKSKLETGNFICFSPEALHRVECCEWRGNVRELENFLERLMILYPGKEITSEDLPEQYRSASRRLDKKQTVMVSKEAQEDQNQQEGQNKAEGQNAFQINFHFPLNFNLKAYLENMEISLIYQALQECGYVVARAAKKLGLRRTTLVEKMRKHAIGREFDTGTGIHMATEINGGTNSY